MKYNYIKATAIALFATMGAHAQTVSTFETLNLPIDSYWDGSNQAGGFTSGNAYFPNSYDTSFGGYWAEGWALGSYTDTLKDDLAGMYYSIAGGGAELSSTYAIGQAGSVIRLQGNAAGKKLNDVYITNTNYAYYSMLNGDQFAKKFGGATGNEPDFLVVTIHAWFNGSLKSDSINFYLADFRNSDNSKDYVIKDWTLVDLSSLGNADSLIFDMNSSDTGMYGMNTPPFFAIDNFTTGDRGVSIAKITPLHTTVYPNPATSQVTIGYTGDIETVSILDLTGKEVLHINASGNTINIADLENGAYILKVQTAKVILTSRIVKQ